MGKTEMNKNKIPFRVSARTARLIGRENIATSKGAIIELVKNGYDADSRISLVYFDNKYSTFHDEISESFFYSLLERGVAAELLNSLYIKDDDRYIVRENISEDLKNLFKDEIIELSALYIIDFGEGMTQNIIRNNWMTIGTDNKANNIFTASGRVKAGAKGIGRFALDKLGGKCEMITVFNPHTHGKDFDEEGDETNYNAYRWTVNWEDFEGDFKTIDTVGATLEGLENFVLMDEILKLNLNLDLNKFVELDLSHGTILKITDLRDLWEDFFVGQVYTDLEVLVPPKENGGFEIFVLSSLFPNKYGEVLGSLCDDFDYKLVATADEKQNVTIKIFRNEYDVALIPNDFFLRENMLNYPYTKKEFQAGYWESKKTFSQLLSGFRAVDQDNVFDNIGVFEFTFYFLKRSNNSNDAARFFNRNFMSNNRKDWLNKFGGIKLFRDNFRVRPYGEVKDAAFDWLSLGSRKTISPAGIAKEEGGYRVEPDNVAGAIKISRLTNVNFEDKSSREGLQENKTFQIFKLLLTAIIAEFEEDRSYIAKEMNDYDNIKYGAERDRKKAEDLARKILADSRAKKQKDEEERGEKGENKENPNQTDSNGNFEGQSKDDQEKEILAGEIERKDEEIENLKKEQKVLRGLASSGIVLASFSHDLSKLNDVLSSRTDRLRDLISQKISEADYVDTIDRRNPFKQLERIKKQDVKLQNWLNFSLGATRKDKRKRKQLFFNNYFKDFKNDWETILENRGIELDISEVEQLDMRVYEIDIDSIYNNLLVNSIDAFIISKENRPRKIKIKCSANQKGIIIDYEDNGPGLSSDIIDVEKIFEPLYTTKRNQYTGEEEGTGLGMWLVKSIVQENDGTINLLYPEVGFGLRISFPVKFKKQE
jgi:signal transduction histidine kinase